MTTAPYSPIDCSFHDRLEHHAVLGRVVRVVYRDENHADGRVAEAVIRDVFAQDCADWVQLVTEDSQTFTIRADAILSVDGVTPSQSSTCR